MSIQVEKDYDEDEMYDDEEDDEYLDDEDDLASLAGQSISDSVFSMARAANKSRKPNASGSVSGYDPTDVIDNPPELSREDFESIMDDFLDKYEVVGKRMVPKMEGTTGADKLEIVRRTLMGMEMDDENGGQGQGEMLDEAMRKKDADWIKERYMKEDPEEVKRQPKEKMPVLSIIGKDKNKWDAETILSELAFPHAPLCHS